MYILEFLLGIINHYSEAVGEVGSAGGRVSSSLIIAIRATHDYSIPRRLTSGSALLDSPLRGLLTGGRSSW